MVFALSEPPWQICPIGRRRQPPPIPLLGFASASNQLITVHHDSAANDGSKSYYGLSVEAFPKEIVDILLAPIDGMAIEIM